MNRWLGLFLFVALWAPSLGLAASESQLLKQRQDFVAAEKALLNGNLAEFERLSARLVDYPLLPYLQYTRLRRSLGTTSPEKISAFVDQYYDTPLAKRLHSHHLKRLAQKRDWSAYADHYVFSENIEVNCRYQLALYHTGYKEIALNTAAKIWTHPRSLPKSCDPLFKHWFAAGGPSTDTAWQRFELAINARQLQLAKYLLRFLPESDQTMATYWRSLQRNPLAILNGNVPSPDHAYHDRMLLYAAVQTARIAPERLEEVWSKTVTQRDIDSALIYEAIDTIALVLARKHDPAARDWFERLPADARDLDNSEWYLRTLLRAQDWQAVSKAIQQLPAEHANTPQWRYWQARALEQLGEDKASKTVYETIADGRSYYGFLAADRLQREYQFNVDILQYTQTDIDNIEELDAVKRIKELVALKRETDARREWFYLLSYLDNEGLKKFATLLHQWGWHDRAILTMARSDHRDDLEIRFPVLHKDIVNEKADKYQLEPSLILAMIRQESAYNVEAHSHAGARGLMQLMPGTAHNVAKSLGLQFNDNRQLYNPELNVSLGSSYIAQMMERFNHNSILATAAYNAGPHRVKRWLPSSGPLAADIWVDTIPFTETRGYVKNVHAYIAVYNHRLGKSPIIISQQMKPVGPEIIAQNNQAGALVAGSIAALPGSN